MVLLDDHFRSKNVYINSILQNSTSKALQKVVYTRPCSAIHRVVPIAISANIKTRISATSGLHNVNNNYKLADV